METRETFVIKPREADIGGLTVRRSLPGPTLRAVGPWVFFDHMGPADFEPGSGLDVIPHPHIHLATVTYLFEGEILHRDSIGSVQTIRAGAINLMIAGKGIVHSERTDAGLRAKGHRAHGLQLWMALPEDKEEVEPSFHHHSASSIPSGKYGGVQVRVMVGSAFGMSSPVPTFSSALFAEAAIPADEHMTLKPERAERAVYLITGRVAVNGGLAKPPAMLSLAPDVPIEIQAIDDAKIIIIGGESLGKRYMWWNFVSSSQDRIEQAKNDWKNGAIGQVPGETESAALPESDSFSRMK